MKTIVLAINDLEFGGGQLTVVNEANALKRVGHNVYVLTFRDKKSDFEKFLQINPENRVFLNANSFFDARCFWKLIRFIRKVRPDFVLSNLFFSNTLIRIAKIFYPRMKVIVREGNMPEEKSFLVKTIDFLLYFLTFKIIVNAKAIADSFNFLPKNKFAVIYNGVDAEFFVCPQRTQKEKFVILNVASLQLKKGHLYLLDAIGEIAKKRKDFKLFVAGDGYLKKKLQKIAFDRGLGEFVEFLGCVGRIELRDLFCKSDIFVLTSLWEGLPNTMFEAMASGLPIVATAVGGIPEIIKDNENGILIRDARDPKAIAETILKVLENTELRKKLGTSALESLRNFTWEKHVSSLLELMELK